MGRFPSVLLTTNPLSGGAVLSDKPLARCLRDPQGLNPLSGGRSFRTHCLDFQRFRGLGGRFATVAPEGPAPG